MAGRTPKLMNNQPISGNLKRDEDKTANGPKQFSVLDSKKIDVVRTHRHFLANSLKLMRGKVISKITVNGHNEPKGAVGSSFRTTVPSDLESVFASEMEEDVERVFVNRILRLILTEDPMVGFTATNVVGQDEKGGAVRVSIYNIPQNEEFSELLAFGTKLGIINPYHRVAADGKEVIRVDDPSQVVHLGKIEKMCRFCGDENPQQGCSKCQVTYCSRECQVADWKELNHKVICKK